MASAAYTAIRYPGETLGKVKDHFSTENRRKRAVQSFKAASDTAKIRKAEADRLASKQNGDGSFKGTASHAIAKQLSALGDWNKNRLSNKVKKLSFTAGASNLVQQKNKSK